MGSAFESSTTNEMLLIRDIITGDKGALDEFTRRYQDVIVASVRKTFRRFGAVATSEDASDAIAETWVALLKEERRKLRLFDPSRGIRLESWISLIAKNCTIDQLRSRDRATIFVEDFHDQEPFFVDTCEPERELCARQSTQLAREALARLNSEEKAFYQSYFRDEKSPEEISSQLGISLNTVYTRKFKLKDKLSRIVAEMESEKLPFAIAA